MCKLTGSGSALAISLLVTLSLPFFMYYRVGREIGGIHSLYLKKVLTQIQGGEKNRQK